MASFSISPLVSVIIPTYNRAEYVAQAVQSALQQTYPAIEVIVIDDGSTDTTYEALTPYLGRIQYIYQQNQGVAVARNKAIEASKGEYIALLDSDDVWLPDKITRQMEFLLAHPNVALTACHVVQIDKHGRQISNAFFYPAQKDGIVPLEIILLDSPLTTSTIVVKRNCLPVPFPFPPGLSFGEDWEMCLRVAARSSVGFVAKPLAQARAHDGNVTASLVGQQKVDLRLKNRLQVIESVFPLFPGSAEYLKSLRACVEAVEYFSTSIPSYLNREFDVAAQRLSAAILLDPTTWQSGLKLAELILHYASQLVRKQNDEEALSFLKNIFAHLPAEVKHTEQLRRVVYTRTHVAMAFKHYERLNYKKVWTNIWQAVRYDISCLKNRGVLSILVRSLVLQSRADIRQNPSS